MTCHLSLVTEEIEEPWEGRGQGEVTEKKIFLGGMLGRMQTPKLNLIFFLDHPCPKRTFTSTTNSTR
jgi:hypothetical protein